MKVEQRPGVLFAGYCHIPILFAGRDEVGNIEESKSKVIKSDDACVNKKKDKSSLEPLRP